MNRANYYNYIEEKLHTLAHRITTGGKLNMLSLHLHSESFYQHFFNLLYNYNLINLNQESQNVEAIDLIDRKKKIIIQVSSTSTKAKIEDALDKKSLVNYNDYTFKFISIAKDASDLRKKSKKDKETKKYKMIEVIYKNPHSIDFEPSRDIYDITSILSKVDSLDIDKLKEVFDFIQKELGDNSSQLNPNLTTKSSAHDSSFIGREDEVKAIDKMLKSSNSLLLINGIGGIGKSSLANYYLYTREKEFDYYGFIDGLDSFISEFRNSLELKAQKEEDLYREIISKLQGLQGKKLLVIDNVEDMKSHKNLIEMILSLHKYDYKVLFTSRRKIEHITAYYLGTLPLNDARELFLNCFKKEEREKINKSKVNKIIKYLGRHTLFIKLVAETIENEGYSLDYILEKFENGELSKIVFGDEESDDDITFNKILQDLFSMQTLNDRSKLLLKRLAVLPSDIELSFLEEILGKERLKRRLDFLVGRGWLIENKGSYKLHQIIKEFILANYAPCFEEAENIIDYFLTYEIKEERWITNYLESVVSSCKRSEMKDKKIGNLSRLLGSKYYDDLANRKKSKKYLEYAKSIYIEIGEEIHIDIYHRLGAIDNNLKYLEKALSQYEKENNERQTAICLSDIGTLHWDEGLPDEALLYFKKELELLEENNFTYLAINYNQQSLVYKDKRDIDKAFEYQFKAIDLIKKAIKGDSSWFNKREQAQFINNLGELYMDETEEFDLALEYIRESLELRKKNLHKGHERFGESYDNLAIIKKKMGNFCKAYEYQLKAIKIWEKSHPERDSYLKDAEERLKGLEWKVTTPHTP